MMWAVLAATILFKDVAAEAGIDFVHENTATPRKHLVETMPGGVAVFDFDGDGRLDIFFTNGAALPSLEKDSPKHANRLFRNLGGMRFADVTEAAGLRGAGYAMAAAVADYDNDGDPDLFVGGVHRQFLYRNTGGRFEDVTARAGVGSAEWVVGAGWVDYDNDGRLDLLSVNYTAWTPGFDRFCGDSARDIRVYCHPRWFTPVPLSLHRNRGDGTFEDVTARSGIGRHKGRGMGIAFADYDQDGLPDVFVANDKLPSFLFHNRPGGVFEEIGLLAGVALPEHGQEVSAMGADFRDYDNDGLPDIHVTALAGESYPLFRNLGKGLFEDVTLRARLSPLVASRSGWSNGFFDFDNDGWKDLFTANAHVNDAIERFEQTAYKLPNSVFRNMGDGTFSDASAPAGLPLAAPIWHSAPELQILDDGAHPAATPQTLTGSLYDLVAPVDKVVRPVGEWNEARVVVRGPHVEHWLNGRKVLEYEIGSEALRSRIAASKFKAMPRFARETEGHVGLQHHGEEAWFRNIRIRALRP